MSIGTTIYINWIWRDVKKLQQLSIYNTIDNPNVSIDELENIIKKFNAANKKRTAISEHLANARSIAEIESDERLNENYSQQDYLVDLLCIQIPSLLIKGSLKRKHQACECSVISYTNKFEESSRLELDNIHHAAQQICDIAAQKGYFTRFKRQKTHNWYS